MISEFSFFIYLMCHACVIHRSVRTEMGTCFAPGENPCRDFRGRIIILIPAIPYLKNNITDIFLIAKSRRSPWARGAAVRYGTDA